MQAQHAGMGLKPYQKFALVKKAFAESLPRTQDGNFNFDKFSKKQQKQYAKFMSIYATIPPFRKFITRVTGVNLKRQELLNYANLAAQIRVAHKSPRSAGQQQTSDQRSTYTPPSAKATPKEAASTHTEGMMPAPNPTEKLTPAQNEEPIPSPRAETPTPASAPTPAPDSLSMREALNDVFGFLKDEGIIELPVENEGDMSELENIEFEGDLKDLKFKNTKTGKTQTYKFKNLSQKAQNTLRKILSFMKENNNHKNMALLLQQTRKGQTSDNSLPLQNQNGNGY